MSVKSILLFESLGLFVLRGPQRNSSAQPRLHVLGKALFNGAKTCESQCMLHGGIQWVRKTEGKVCKFQAALSKMCVKECELEMLMRQMPSNFECTILLWFISGILKELPPFSPLKKNQTQTQEWHEGNKTSYLCNYFAHDLESGLRFLVHFVFMLGSFQGSERYTCEWLKGTLTESLL